MKIIGIVFLILFLLGCSASNKMKTVILEQFKDGYELVETPDISDLVLVKGVFINSESNIRVDFVVINKRTSELVYRMAGLNGTVDWISNKELKICDYPAMPVSEDYRGCLIYNIETQQKSSKFK